VFEVSIEMGPDPREMPELTATAVNPLSEITIAYPENLPGFAEITVLANDGGTHSTYRIYFSVDGSYTDATLDSIRIAGELLDGFSPDVYEYDVVLPADVSKYWGLSGYAHVDGAWVITSKPASLPGEATIDITAVDGVTTATYVLNITLATDIESFQSGIQQVRLVYPLREQIHLRIQLGEPAPLHVRICQLNGSLICEQGWTWLNSGANDIFMPLPPLPGIYIYEVIHPAWRNSGIFFN
jgi:hypothetical protein